MATPAIPVNPGDITPAWLSDVLQADVAACELEQIGVGVGLLGRLYRAHLEGVAGVPETVVVKLPTLDATARFNLCEDLEFYLREVRFYQEIGRANPLPPARPYFAAFDDATHDFVLVLEDLGRLRNADQTRGCGELDAATVMDAIARHHAHWWQNERLAALGWLKTYATPPFPDVIAGNYRAAWPIFLEHLGGELSPALRQYGERFPSLTPWLLDQIARPPRTFLHGDLRLDQLFFSTDADAPVRALDWQVTGKGRGAYDVAYFLTQSLCPETRRRSESRLIERYSECLTALGIDYPQSELNRDYRIATAWCFIYPVMAVGRIDIANERQLELARTMLAGTELALADHDLLTLEPD